MTQERTHAYRRVVRTIAELGPAKLHQQEQEQIREAVDTLIFCRDLDGDDAARNALQDVERLCRTLVGNGRWQQETAMSLARDVALCGPDVPVTLKAA